MPPDLSNSCRQGTLDRYFSTTTTSDMGLGQHSGESTTRNPKKARGFVSISNSEAEDDPIEDGEKSDEEFTEEEANSQMRCEPESYEPHKVDSEDSQFSVEFD